MSRRGNRHGCKRTGPSKRKRTNLPTGDGAHEAAVNVNLDRPFGAVVEIDLAHALSAFRAAAF